MNLGLTVSEDLKLVLKQEGRVVWCRSELAGHGVGFSNLKAQSQCHLPQQVPSEEGGPSIQTYGLMGAVSLKPAPCGSVRSS